MIILGQIGAALVTLLMVETLNTGERIILREPYLKPAECERLAARVRKKRHLGRPQRIALRVVCLPSYVPGPFASNG